MKFVIQKTAYASVSVEGTVKGKIGKGFMVLIGIGQEDNEEIAVPITDSEGRERIYNSQVIYPIISEGDAIGSVVILAKDRTKKFTDVESKIAESAANFLGSHLEI